MLLEFTISNYRSIKEKTTFSLIAEPARSKSDNIFAAEIAKKEKVRLLKTAAIYGPNASGKTNILKAFNAFVMFIVDSNLKAGEDISFYDPFTFDKATESTPTYFCLSFIGPQNVKYVYEFEYNSQEIISENLFYYPKGSKTILFTRSKDTDPEDLIHLGKLGSIYRNKEIKVFKNKLILSKFGEDEPHELLSLVYIHFLKYKFLNLNSRNRTINRQRFELNELFVTDKWFQDSINFLINSGDLMINEIQITENNQEDLKFQGELPESIKKRLFREFKYKIAGNHNYFDGERLIGQKSLPISQESKGTEILYDLGGTILKSLNDGSVLFVDELETSLHPNLCKLLIDIFQSPSLNTNGSQLIFTTHDVTLLDKSLFRKDQIWICQKDKFGSTDVYSIQDFKEVREETPFARWYLAGKFGGLPKIKYSNDLFSSIPLKHVEKDNPL
ncbi:MAG: ATP-binding protein [Lacibacter sp.]|jgi:AAA15 family ATPase/GTPase